MYYNTKPKSAPKEVTIVCFCPPTILLIFSTLMANFLLATNLGCVNSMWFFMGTISLNLLYLINIFRRVDLWHKSWTLTCLVLQLMHCNICKFSTSIGKLSLIAKKSQHIQSWLCFQVVVWACMLQANEFQVQ